MPIAEWREEYNVNVEQIDLQHQQLLRLVNRLHASVEARIDKIELMKMLVELVEFTRTHFETEETLMRDNGFPGLAGHNKEHRMLLQHMESLVRAVSNGQTPTFYSDYDISSDWALEHIFVSDKPLGVFLNSKGIY